MRGVWLWYNDMILLYKTYTIRHDRLAGGYARTINNNIFRIILFVYYG